MATPVTSPLPGRLFHKKHLLFLTVPERPFKKLYLSHPATYTNFRFRMSNVAKIKRHLPRRPDSFANCITITT